MGQDKPVLCSAKPSFFHLIPPRKSPGLVVPIDLGHNETAVHNEVNIEPTTHDITTEHHEVPDLTHDHDLVGAETATVPDPHGWGLDPIAKDLELNHNPDQTPAHDLPIDKPVLADPKDVQDHSHDLTKSDHEADTHRTSTTELKDAQDIKPEAKDSDDLTKVEVKADADHPIANDHQDVQPETKDSHDLTKSEVKVDADHAIAADSQEIKVDTDHAIAADPKDVHPAPEVKVDTDHAITADSKDVQDIQPETKDSHDLTKPDVKADVHDPIAADSKDVHTPSEVKVDADHAIAADPKDVQEVNLEAKDSGDLVKTDAKGAADHESVKADHAIDHTGDTAPKLELLGDTLESEPQLVSDITSGYYTADATGKVEFTFIADSGTYQGQLAAVSLSGLENFDLNSHEFFQEALRRAISGSEAKLGYIVVDDINQGAKFSGDLGEGVDLNFGEFAGPTVVQFNPGDKFFLLLIPNSSVEQVAADLDHGITQDARPLFSLVAANPTDAIQLGQIIDVTGDGNTYVFEDVRQDGGSDKDFNDLIFQVKGATIKTVTLDDLILEGELKPEHDWRETTVLGQEIVAYAQSQVITTPEPLPLEKYDFPKEDQPLIGFIDTHLTTGNPDINYSNIIFGKDYIENDSDPTVAAVAGEGTHLDHILGIVGATQDNGVGIDGINDKAPLWVSSAVESGKWADSLVEFVDTARASHQPHAIANLSIDLTQVNPDGSVTTRYEFTPQERAAIEYARQSGVLIVAASGNDGGVMSVLGQASQEFDNIITVGASDGVHRADYSSYGYGLDIVAPGGTVENPIVSDSGDGLGSMAGTSVATAEVTGAASQVWAANPELSYRQVIEILKETATDLDTPGWDAETGAGLLDITAAVGLARTITPIDYEIPATLIPDTWSGEGKVTPTERAAAVPMWPSIEPSGFSGWVMATAGANVRSGPGTNFARVGGYSYKTDLQFSGWTYGERVNDVMLGTPDERWYRIAGTNNWIASALIYGNAPGSTPLPPTQPPTQPPIQQPTPIANVPINSGSDNYRKGSKNPFAYSLQGQCTWYAYGRMLETGLLPEAIKNNALFRSNAGIWKNDAQKVGLPVTSTPTAGARGLVVWPPYTKGAGSVGHVAFLEEVYSDGRVRISESNWAGKGISERILTPAQYAGVSFVQLEKAQTNSYYAPPAQPGQGRQYIVRAGDTLSAIAQRELGDASRWREIMKTPSGGTFTDAEARNLQVGQSVYLPVNYSTGTGKPVTSTPVSTPNPTPTPSDPNGTLGTAGNRGSFSDKTDFISDSIGFNGDQNDFFRFRVTNNRTNVNLTLSGLSSDADLELIRDWNNNGRVDPGEVIGSSRNSGTKVDSVSRILDSGDYFIRVLPGISNAKTNYNLSVRTANLSGQVRLGSGDVNLWRYDTGGKTERSGGTFQGIDPSKETAIIIHGWNNSNESTNISNLAKEASEFAPQVLVLDWGSIAQAGLDWTASVPYETASWIAPVAQWVKKRLDQLEINPSQLTLIGHSLGALVSSEIGRLFGRVKNLVALDPAYPADGDNGYDIDINQTGKQHPANFRDVATKSLAFVVADNKAGLLGDNEKAATADNSFLMDFSGKFVTAIDTHGAVVDAFTDALDRRLLTLPDLNLPSHVNNWYDNNGDKDNWWDRQFNPGKHEGTISATWTGNYPNPWHITALKQVVNSSGTEQTTWT